MWLNIPFSFPRGQGAPCWRCFEGAHNAAAAPTGKPLFPAVRNSNAIALSDPARDRLTGNTFMVWKDFPHGKKDPIAEPASAVQNSR
jgi:hypothetical protein